MALQHAILAALATDASSGYDLAKTFDVTVANFWSATPQQLYRELDRMEAAGLVHAEVVEQQKRPNKRIFSLTGAGRDELRDFTAREPRPTAIRDELLVQVDVLEFGDEDAVRSSVEAKLASSTAKLAHYLRSRQHLLGGADEATYLASAHRVGPFLALARGISFEEENIRWCRLVLDVLTGRHA
ncbi:PadR family transcriptional regulator [Nocardioides sambongensis]|uniref:PadR family transcriptional regulator n=1 Tax=Nocardioides sambongensis TaxID=2589074 RepID=UPI001126DF75|nr:PadR family transcriptional regulator [Nocardioides sambongensis]